MSNLSELLPSGGGQNVVEFTAAENISAGQAVAIKTDGQIEAADSTNLANVIGLAAKAISSGATGDINVFGGINEAQSGLTIGVDYYINSSGSLTTSSAPPSVDLGRAISATTINLRDISDNHNPLIQSQQAYTSAGTYSWVAPAGITSVSLVAIGGGGGAMWIGTGGSGAGLGYKNDYSVTPGDSYSVVVGIAGTAAASNGASGGNGGDSYFVDTSTVKGGGGLGGINNNNMSGGTYTGDGGGNGGIAKYAPGGYGSGGGGAGGYAGNGGNSGVGGSSTGGYFAQPTAGSGGGGGGGGSGGFAGSGQYPAGAGGGGTGILGQGSNRGSGSSSQTSPTGGGGGGSGGGTGINGSYTVAGAGGAYGAGGASGSYAGGFFTGTAGKNGAVRIIWSNVNTRTFPSTNTGDL